MREKISTTETLATIKEKCFACGRSLEQNPAMADTRDAQIVFVGRECMKKIIAAGERGYQPPQGGLRLFVLQAGSKP